MNANEIIIRTASEHDAAALRRLAELDSNRVPDGQLLVAEHRGTPVAALSLEHGDHIADPFRRTAEAVELLRLRARQLVGEAGTTFRFPALAGRLGAGHTVARLRA